MPLNEELLEAVTGDPRMLLVDESKMDEVFDVTVVVNVNGSVTVTPVVKGAVVRGAVGAVFSGEVSLQGVENAGDEDPVAGLPSVDEESETGK